MFYTFYRIKQEIITTLSEIASEINVEELEFKLPPPQIKGDLAIPFFTPAKTLKITLEELTQRISSEFRNTISKRGTASYLLDVVPVKGYINFLFNFTTVSTSLYRDWLAQGENYGTIDLGKGATVVIDYSSPNIAKPMNIGHLRSTIIGQALYNLFKFTGFRVIGDNHLGDWGTQFGKLLYAYYQWGEREKIENNPIPELLKLYVLFHQKAQELPSLEEEARKLFKKLEEKDSQVWAIWKWIRDLSIKDFNKVYKKLGVNFELVLGESFYNDLVPQILDELLAKGIAFIDQDGSVVADLNKYGITTPLLLRKKDGASVYASRDIAAAVYRIKEFSPALILYVVGSEQKLYFQQWFKVLELMGYKDVKCVHIPFGLITLPEGKLSTRLGRIVLLEEVIDQAIQKAKEILQERPFTEEEKEQIATQVGIGAIKYGDLSQNRLKDIVFSWDRLFALEENSAPYLQYTYARIQSIFRKASTIEISQVDFTLLINPEEKNIIKLLIQFPEVIRQCIETYFPHILANYLFELAQAYAVFYNKIPVLKAENEKLKLARLQLSKLVATVIKRGLSLLGIECPERM